jgi:hypothetical protein
MVVFPAASSPSIKIRFSCDPHPDIMSRMELK